MHCAYCGSALRPGDPWCGLCLRPAGAPEPARAEEPAYAPPPAYAVAVAVATAPARALLAGGYEPPPAPVQDLTPPEPPPRGAGLATALAIGVGALGQAVFWYATRGRTENEAAIRYAIVTTLGVYLVVAVIVLRRVARDGHPLRWRGEWPVWTSALAGVVAGGGLASFLLAVATAAGSDGGGDPRVDLLVSEGDVAHIAASVLIACVAAPLLEELLFRGLLLASLQRYSNKVAVPVSALAFSVWHLNPGQLRYYAVMGALLGWLYLKRGLACSIAMHASFNGILTVATVGYVLAPGPVASVDGLVLRAPHGWHQRSGDGYVALTGPSGSDIAAGRLPGPATYVDADLLWDRVGTGSLPGTHDLEVRRETARPVDLPAGRALRVRVRAQGHDGDVVLLPVDGRLYVVIFTSGGSTRARRDFDRILHDLTVG